MTPDIMKLIRVQQRLSQEDFADRVGVSRSLISQIERGEKRLTNDTAIKIKRTFGITDKGLMRLIDLNASLKSFK